MRGSDIEKKEEPRCAFFPLYFLSLFSFKRCISYNHY